MTNKNDIYSIRVQGKFHPEYWMNIQASENTNLNDLDDFLRSKWLETDHPSMFIISYIKYSGCANYFHSDENVQDTDTQLKDVLSCGMQFDYKYDFCDTTTLSSETQSYCNTTSLVLNVTGITKLQTKDKITLIERNKAPQILCQCGKKAIWICNKCAYKKSGCCYCKYCSSDHECGEGTLFPVLNSPRMGVGSYGYWLI